MISPVLPLVSAATEPQGFVSRAESLPRKVVVATTVAAFTGPLEQRIALAVSLIDQAADKARARWPTAALDLVVLPEFAFLRETGANAAERAIAREDPLFEILGRKAREHRTWLIAPMTLTENGERPVISNAAVLFDRRGAVAGIYRKVYPVPEPDGQLEGGVTPGTEYPVFECDFGRLGILICWDMAYEAGWRALADAGAEIVALPSASPQTLRPAAEALRHRFYVVTSTPRDNASLFDPIGRVVAQTTHAPGVSVHQIDLAYALLHWSAELREGQALRDRFGDRVGYEYSSREDTGVFWSNDPQMSIGAMIRELGLREMPVEVERAAAARRAALEKAAGEVR